MSLPKAAAQEFQSPGKLQILHLYSSWKWTGPAEPVSLLIRHLRRLGLEVEFWLPPPPRPEFESLGRELDLRGISHTLVPALDRKRLFSAPSAIREILRFLARRQPALLHTHHSHEHWLAGIACRLSRRPARLVRSDFQRDGIPTGELWKPLEKVTDAVVTFSEMSRQSWIAARRMAPAQVVSVSPCFDAERVRPGSPCTTRADLGFQADDFVVGLACRLQQDRHLGVFFAGIAEAAKHVPQLRVLILGRSSQSEETVKKPLRELGLEGRTVWAGHRRDDYFSYLGALDLLVFTRAGSDGTGRGLLEAMALGVPTLVQRTGMLPEFLPEGSSTPLFDGTASDLTRQIIRLAHEPQTREEWARLGRRHSIRFRPEHQAKQLAALYRKLGG